MHKLHMSTYNFYTWTKVKYPVVVALYINLFEMSRVALFFATTVSTKAYLRSWREGNTYTLRITHKDLYSVDSAKDWGIKHISTTSRIALQKTYSHHNPQRIYFEPWCYNIFNGRNPFWIHLYLGTRVKEARTWPAIIMFHRAGGKAHPNCIEGQHRGCEAAL